MQDAKKTDFKNPEFKPAKLGGKKLGWGVKQACGTRTDIASLLGGENDPIKLSGVKKRGAAITSREN